MAVFFLPCDAATHFNGLFRSQAVRSLSRLFPCFIKINSINCVANPHFIKPLLLKHPSTPDITPDISPCTIHPHIPPQILIIFDSCSNLPKMRAQYTFQRHSYFIVRITLCQTMLVSFVRLIDRQTTPNVALYSAKRTVMSSSNYMSTRI